MFLHQRVIKMSKFVYKHKTQFLFLCVLYGLTASALYKTSNYVVIVDSKEDKYLLESVKETFIEHHNPESTKNDIF